MRGTKVHEVMSGSPPCVTPETPVSEAAELMLSEDIGSLPIVDGEQLAGVVTDRDIVIRAIAKQENPSGMPVREVASRDLLTVHADDTLADALKLMASEQVWRLPVVDKNNKLVGVLAQADVAAGAKKKAAGEMFEGISKSRTRPRPGETTADVGEWTTTAPDSDTNAPVDDDPDDVDRILGEEWIDPRQQLLLNALEAHPERELIAELQHEMDGGLRRWSLCRQLEDDGWVEVWLRPWPLDRFDARPPIKVGAWPMMEAEIEPTARAEAIADEHDDTR